MERDLRGTPVWSEVEAFYANLHGPALGRVSGAADIHPDAAGGQVAFTATVLDALDGAPRGRICTADLAAGTLAQITDGRSDDRLPRWSPDGALAFLSDRATAGVAQAYVTTPGENGDPRLVGPMPGVVESIAWSPDGTQLLLVVAGLGADLAGGQGSGINAATAADLPNWMPAVEGTVRADSWRRVWTWQRATGSIRCVSADDLTCWEAAWAGPGAIAAVVSDDPGEGAWYTARLELIDLASGSSRTLLRPSAQVGVPAGSPDGRHVAILQAMCSDRQVVAGDVVLIDVATGEGVVLDVLGADATFHAFRDDDTLFFIGQRGLDTVAGEALVAERKTTEVWVSGETCGGRYPEAWPLPDGGCCLVAESWSHAPEVAVVDGGRLRTVVSFDHDGARWFRTQVGPVEAVRWLAPDGLEIEGLLARPLGDGPYPLVVHVHGGPVWAWRNKWLLQFHAPVALLVANGFAVLSPNPRGSSGRGQDFAHRVFGGMGDDVGDFVAGVDHLVALGVADPARVGVTGGSYGGFMASWLVTQTDRFAAAVPMAPVTDWRSQHFTSNIGYFDALFLDDSPTVADGAHWSRSPLSFAANVTTPTLHIAGAEDRCTPPTQALEFHRALVEHGRAPSELVVYPGEGHGIRRFPAAIDLGARVLTWFRTYLKG